MSEKNFVFVSDLHLSEGYLKDDNCYHPNEDFYFDDVFGRFLGHLQTKREAEGYKYPWRLVIVGDFLENLQITTLPRVPANNNEKGGPPKEKDSPEAVDELADFLRNVQTVIYPEEKEPPEVPPTRLSKNEKKYGLGFDAPSSVWKLARIIDGHPGFFAALAEFLAAGNELVIVKGNHDPEFTYPEVRRYLVDHVNQLAQQHHAGENVTGRIFFSPWFYYEPGLFYAEHGGQYDEANQYTFFLDPTMINEKTGVRTIRFPLFGSSFVRYFFNIIEEEVPFADNVRPQTKALWWIVFHKPGFTLWRLPILVKCISKFLRKKVFHGFDLLALREKYKSEGFFGYLAFVFFTLTALLLVRPKHREEYRLNKISNLREMNRLENTDGVLWTSGAGAASGLSLRELLRIYYGSFGDKAAAVDDAGLDDVQRGFAENAEQLDAREEKTLNAVVAKIRGAAKAKPRIPICFIKRLDCIAIGLLTLTFALTCRYYGDYLLAGLVAFLVIAGLSFFILRDLKSYLLARFFNIEPERYLNKAAAGVAGLLGPERVRFVIFGHTHVAYARPIKDDEGTCEGEHQERAGIRPSQWEINTGSWTPVFDERMMLRQHGDELPFIQIVTEKRVGTHEFELNRWNDELGQPQRIRFVGEV